ncbi:MAG: TlpA family protein disulfide reductase [Ilumatobacteraceae bacterium]
MTKRPARPAPPPPPPKKSIWLWVGIGAVIAIALGIAVWSTTGNDKKVTVGTTGTDNSSSSPAETQPVNIVGTPLVKQTASGVDQSANGVTPPTLKGFTFAGAPIDITPGTPNGRAKMVVFLAHWCPHCNREIPVIEAWAAAGGVPADLDIIGVSTGVSAQADNYPPSQWIVKMKWKWPVMADSPDNQAALAYGVGGYPTFVIIGADGKVRVRNSGELPQANLDALVKQALAG